MKQQIIVLTSPPASGKTHLISHIISELNAIPLVIVPLRALAEECKKKWGEQAVVMTPEEWMIKQPMSELVIFDEFHLYFYWGDSFRPNMWEAFYSIMEKSSLVFFLTATLNQECHQYLIDISNLFSITWIDFGNQCLKYLPRSYLKAYHKSWIERKILLSPPSTKGNLIFCQFRQEVLVLEKKLLHAGFSVWTCLGGEAARFSQRVENESPPQFIVATSVLSHGVNLPSIGTVYLTYKVNNLDFWIQMVARGGRKGEAFKVIALQTPKSLKWNRGLNFLTIQWLSFKMELENIRRQCEEWFLKD